MDLLNNKQFIWILLIIVINIYIIVSLIRKKRYILILIFLILSVIAFYLILFKKLKDYYIIKHVGTYITLKQTNDQFIELSLKIEKEYISTSKSKRMLFGSTIEPGINGIIDTNILVNIYQKIGDSNFLLNDYFFAHVDKLIANNQMITSEYEIYSKKISLTQFLKDIKNNEPYTRGIAFDNVELFFIVHKNSIIGDNETKEFEINIKTPFMKYNKILKTIE